MARVVPAPLGAARREPVLPTDVGLLQLRYGEPSGEPHPARREWPGLSRRLSQAPYKYIFR